MNHPVRAYDDLDANAPPAPVPVWLVERAERTEAAWMRAVVATTPDPARFVLGTSATDVEGGVVLSATNDPTRYLAKALGFGFDAPVTSSTVGKVIDFYRSRGESSATLQLAPQVLPLDWPQIVEDHGLILDGSWSKHAADVALLHPGSMPSSETDLRIERVEAWRLAEWGTVIVRGMGMPDLLGQTLAAGASTDDVYAFGAFHDDQIVAGALLGVHGTTAGLGSAATLPRFRNRGAQTALIAARIAAARELGCEWVVAETDASASGQSHKNLTRAGLSVLYGRQNWVWRD